MNIAWTILSSVGTAVLLSSCAESTGILPMGPDTYTVTENYAPVRGGAATAEKVALTEANRYCQQQGKVFVATNMQKSVAPFQAAYGPTKYSLVFHCLLPNDSSLRPPSYERAPDVVIEERSE